MNNIYLLGYDIGSSSIKATLLKAETGEVVASSYSPKTELPINSKEPGWAEQDPRTWWEHVKIVTNDIKKTVGDNIDNIEAIGISYQMHGLVVVDKNYNVLYPSIIWCDSRAVKIGDKAFNDIGKERCLKTLLNSPGNFTASKLKWLMENEPKVYEKIYKIMLPGDYIAMMMTDEINTTPSGLSEGIMWDFNKNKLSDLILSHYGISKDLIPDIVTTFSPQGELTKKAAEELGLKPGIKIAYRAGDQPNNAFSLNVLKPGELATTAGTSGVVYGVTNKANYDERSRVNTFVHVNNTEELPHYGILLCINGTGIMNSWARKNFLSTDTSYNDINKLADEAPIGSDGLIILPYGNGAERTLENKNINASIYGLNFNIHSRSHLLRAIQEGIVFALNYGLQIMGNMGVEIKKIRAGNANMFLSPIFKKTFSTLSDAEIELYNTDGSQGAARGAGIGAGIYHNSDDAFKNLKIIEKISPDIGKKNSYEDAYNKWLEILKKNI